MELKTSFPSDNELLYLIADNNEDAIEALFIKYKGVLNYYINKYSRSCYALGIEFDDLKSEVYYAFIDAVNNYDNLRDSKLCTYINLCVNCYLQKFLRKNSTKKACLEKYAFSLENEIGDELILADIIGDNKFNPEVKVEAKDYLTSLTCTAKKILNKSEYEVYDLLLNEYSYEDISNILNISIKSVYNRTSRMKSKIKELIS